MDPKTQADLDNHANQLNPNHSEYHNSRNVDTTDDDDDDTNNNNSTDEDFANDADDFHEEWLPQDAW